MPCTGILFLFAEPGRFDEMSETVVCHVKTVWFFE